MVMEKLKTSKCKMKLQKSINQGFSFQDYLLTNRSSNLIDEVQSKLCEQFFVKKNTQEYIAIIQK